MNKNDDALGMSLFLINRPIVNSFMMQTISGSTHVGVRSVQSITNDEYGYITYMLSNIPTFKIRKCLSVRLSIVTPFSQPF